MGPDVLEAEILRAARLASKAAHRAAGKARSRSMSCRLRLRWQQPWLADDR
jgi:hypothetical protein